MSEKVVSVTLSEIKFAISLMSAAAELKLPMANPETKSVTIYDEQTGEETYISFRDTPFNRFFRES